VARRMAGKKNMYGTSRKGKMSYEDSEEMQNKKMMGKRGKKMPRMKK
jgi:hypothetical protein